MMVSKILSIEEMEFADAYLDLANSERHQWAVNICFGAETAEERFKLVMAVIQRADLPEDEEALGLLGAGPHGRHNE